MENETQHKHPHTIPWVIIFVIFLVLIGISLAVFGVQNSFAPTSTSPVPASQY